MYLTQGLHRGVQQYPDAPATIFGERVRTVREQVDRVARLAGALRELGVRDGVRVGILALNSDRYVEALLAVAWADGVVNPVNTRWSPPEISYSLTNCQTEMLFVDDTFVERALELRSRPARLIHLGDGPPPGGTLDYEALIARSRPVEDARRSGSALAGIFYTGGTTGTPKGVMLSHANIVSSLLGVQATVPAVVPGGRTLLVAPLFHLATLGPWTAQLMVGGTHVILPAFDPDAVLGAVENHQITTAALIPTIIQRLVDHPTTADRDLSSVQSLMYGGSAISQDVLARAMQAFPMASFTQVYGMTELAGMATLLGPAEHRAGRRLRSAGRAAVHTEIRIIDDTDHEVPPGTVGEIVCRGGPVMLGYWDQPTETEQALRGGWMHTGDSGYLDDEGYLHIVDRIKDMIITGGENVYSTEVEHAVSSHPAVAACAVIGVPDTRMGERVHAVVQLKPGCTADPGSIRDHCKTLVGGYKVPRSFEFVDALPLSGAGKPLKRELRAQHWQPAPR